MRLILVLLALCLFAVDRTMAGTHKAKVEKVARSPYGNQFAANKTSFCTISTWNQCTSQPSESCWTVVRTEAAQHPIREHLHLRKA